jgi:hypothetical protein
MFYSYPYERSCLLHLVAQPGLRITKGNAITASAVPSLPTSGWIVCLALSTRTRQFSYRSSKIESDHFAGVRPNSRLIVLGFS